MTLGNPTGNATIADGTGTVVIGAERRPGRGPADGLGAARTRSSARPTATSTSPSASRRPGVAPCRSPSPTRPPNSSADAQQPAATSTTSARAGTLTFAPGETTKIVRVRAPATAPTASGLALVHARPQHPGQRDDRARVRPAYQHRRQLDRRRETPQVFVRDATVDEKDGFALRAECVLGGPAGQASNSTVTVHYETARRDRDGRRRLHAP